MQKISWSQYVAWKSCPQKWKLRYIDKHKFYTDSIHTVYGKAFHETLQTYLTTMYTESIKAADDLDLGNMLVDSLKTIYSGSVAAMGGQHFSKKSELIEFCIQGAKALDWFKKKRAHYFSKTNWELLGIEVPLDDEYNGVKVLGYIDVLMRNTSTGRIRVIDIKTSSRGWRNEKKDPMKRGQLHFYKKFIADKYDCDLNDIDIEFLVFKRLLWENSDFPQKYVQSIEPPSASVSINRTFKEIDIFISECFNKDGSYNTETHYKQLGVENNCKWCEFKDKPQLCDRSGK